MTTSQTKKEAEKRTDTTRRTDTQADRETMTKPATRRC